MAEPLLSVRGIHTYYGDSYVLQGLSLEQRAGSIVAILGRNGMGKTTFIRSVAGLTPPREGEIRFHGRPLAGRPPYAIAQAGIALVPQGRRIFRSLSVRENLLLPTSGLARARAGRWNLPAVLEALSIEECDLFAAGDVLRTIGIRIKGHFAKGRLALSSRRKFGSQRGRTGAGNARHFEGVRAADGDLISARLANNGIFHQRAYELVRVTSRH